MGSIQNVLIYVCYFIYVRKYIFHIQYIKTITIYLRLNPEWQIIIDYLFEISPIRNET